MISRTGALRMLTLAASLAIAQRLRAANPVIVQNEAGFEGLEEATVLYYPDTNTFVPDPDNYPNHLDEGGGLFRDTLRNNYTTQGWWDGDRDTTNTDRQRTEAKGITGLAHQKANQTYEYSFDFRTNAGFSGTSHFCHIFQLKQTENGSSGSPLVTVSLYKNGSTTQGRIQTDSADQSGTIIARTFTFTPDAWNHVIVRITTTDGTTTTGGCLGSINGDAFSGTSNVQLWSDDGAGGISNDYRTKFGLYRGMGTDYGVPAGDSWVEHRTITGFVGSRNVLTWKGGANGNTWDTASTQNFLNGAAASSFALADVVNFNDSTANTTINLSGAVAPEYVRVNASQNYTFTGSGSLTSGTLRKDGAGQLTLATTNAYAGLTDVRAGTLLVSGSIGNSSLISLTGGMLRAGSNTALGSNSTIGTQINGGALDINGFNLSTEPIQVQGAGLSNTGAIVNTGAAQTSALTNVTMTGDATFGGSGRWDIRGTGAKLNTASSAFNLTKTGTNQISFVGAAVDPALANITINQGILSFQTSTSSMGDAAKTVAVNSGAALGFFNTSNVMTKVCKITGGTIWAESGSTSQNVFAGPITLLGAGGTFDAGGALTGGTPNSAAVLNLAGNITGNGGLTKIGPGLVTLAGSNDYSGATAVNAGTLAITRTFISSAAVTIASAAQLNLAQAASSINPVVLKTPALTIAGAGALDLANNALIVDYTGTSPVNTIRSLLQQGYANGSWTGKGITSAAAAANAVDPAELHKSALGYADTSSLSVGSISGQATDQSAVVVRYTLAGDMNLDLTVNTQDFTTLAANFNQSGQQWFNGDFNYDGTVNALDFNLLASNFGSTAVSPGLGTLLPEPNALLCEACLFAGTSRRRACKSPPRV